jgi:hypothetical protein
MPREGLRIVRLFRRIREILRLPLLFCYPGFLQEQAFKPQIGTVNSCRSRTTFVYNARRMWYDQNVHGINGAVTDPRPSPSGTGKRKQLL